MSQTPGRGNLRSIERLTRREQEQLRPEVERLAGKGMSYREIAETLRTPQLPVSIRMVRTIQYKWGIPSGARPGRKQGAVDPAGEGGNAARYAALKAAREQVRPLIEGWIAKRLTDAQMAAALNERGVPTLSGVGQWTGTKVESLRRREGIRSIIAPHHHLQQTKFVIPRGQEAHCNTCDAPIHFDWFGKAALHKRLTSMVVAGIRVNGRCEGSLEPVVLRPLARTQAVALAA